jgi:two-component system, NtrC family, nitrogen regulation response regulator GlnG
MIHKAGAVLVLDDDVDVLCRVERLLKFNGLRDVILCERATQIWPALESGRVFAMILDLVMPDSDGYEVLDQMRTTHPEIPVIVATAVDDLDAVVRCMKAGAFDYVPKSAESARLLASIEHASRIRRLENDNKALRETLLADEIAVPDCFSRIITRDRRMITMFRYITAIAGSDKPVLITGESGTGKELVAEAVHLASGRKGELVSVNMAGLDDTMFSDTLFGHRRGAFTGADTDRAGLIEKAAGGTLFLDEIGDLAPQSQVKLLRLIEQRLYYPLGSDLTRSSDALIVAATNRDLASACDAGSFRIDLFFRLETHRIRLPPLRDRLADLPPLVEAFAEKAATRFDKPCPRIPAELYDLLGTYTFPGNIRELESMVHDAVGRTSGSNLALESFRERIFPDSIPALPVRKRPSGLFADLPVLPSLREAADELIAEAMSRAGDNQGVASALLGISRTALNRRLKGARSDDE